MSSLDIVLYCELLLYYSCYEATQTESKKKKKKTTGKQ